MRLLLWLFAWTVGHGFRVREAFDQVLSSREAEHGNVLKQLNAVADSSSRRGLSSHSKAPHTGSRERMESKTIPENTPLMLLAVHNPTVGFPIGNDCNFLVGVGDTGNPPMKASIGNRARSRLPLIMANRKPLDLRKNTTARTQDALLTLSSTLSGEPAAQIQMWQDARLEEAQMFYARDVAALQAAAKDLVGQLREIELHAPRGAELTAAMAFSQPENAPMDDPHDPGLLMYTHDTKDYTFFKPPAMALWKHADSVESLLDSAAKNAQTMKLSLRHAAFEARELDELERGKRVKRLRVDSLQPLVSELTFETENLIKFSRNLYDLLRNLTSTWAIASTARSDLAHTPKTSIELFERQCAKLEKAEHGLRMLDPGATDLVLFLSELASRTLQVRELAETSARLARNLPRVQNVLLAEDPEAVYAVWHPNAQKIRRLDEDIAALEPGAAKYTDLALRHGALEPLMQRADALESMKARFEASGDFDTEQRSHHLCKLQRELSSLKEFRIQAAELADQMAKLAPQKAQMAELVERRKTLERGTPELTIKQMAAIAGPIAPPLDAAELEQEAHAIAALLLEIAEREQDLPQRGPNDMREMEETLQIDEILRMRRRVEKLQQQAAERALRNAKTGDS